MITTQNPSEFYDKTFGTGESITGTNADLSELESQLKAIDDKISVLSEKIESKKLEIEVITSGKALSDLDRAAREEYVRTGSSSAMQNIENSRANKESIRKENEQDSIVNADSAIDTLRGLYGSYLDHGNTLTNTERADAKTAWDALQKLKGKRGVVKNDKDNNGVEDEIDDIISDLRNAPTTASTKVAPKTNAELEKALGQLVTNEDENALIDLYILNHPAWYVNGDIAINKIPAEETIALERAKVLAATKKGSTTNTIVVAEEDENAFNNEVAGKIPSWVGKKVGRGETLTDSDYKSAYKEIRGGYVNNLKKQKRITPELVKKLIDERLKK